MILDLGEFADRHAFMKKPASIEQAEGAKNLPLIQFPLSHLRKGPYPPKFHSRICSHHHQLIRILQVKSPSIFLMIRIARGPSKLNIKSCNLLIRAVLKRSCRLPKIWWLDRFLSQIHLFYQKMHLTRYPSLSLQKSQCLKQRLKKIRSPGPKIQLQTMVRKIKL